MKSKRSAVLRVGCLERADRGASAGCLLKKVSDVLWGRKERVVPAESPTEGAREWVMLEVLPLTFLHDGWISVL
jgi:hypothetical protein